MKVVLVLNGWRKVHDIDDSIAMSGTISVGILPPLRLIDTGEQIIARETEAYNVTFRATGTTVSGLPIFKAEE